MRIFITGIEGFVGGYLTARLLASGHAVTGLALDPVDSPPDGVRVDACDVLDADRVRAIVRSASPDVVVHLAGQTSGAASFLHPEETRRVNVEGTRNVLHACVDADAGRALVVSSSEIYGEGQPESGPVDEDAPIAPVTPYGESKAEQDRLAERFGASTPLAVIRARSFPHTGPGQDTRFVFPSVAARIARAEREDGDAGIEVGNLDVVRDVSDVRDIVRAYERLIEVGEAGRAYNVCSGVGAPLGERLAEMRDLAKRPIEFITHGDRLRPADVSWMVGRPDRLVAATGWRPRIAWPETAAALLKHARTKLED
jgi:GDP-4-dehydro-6-deoxy-D-mannose reductase